MKISQTDFIVGAIALAFVVYITSKGELAAYLSVFKKGDDKSAANTNGFSQWVDQTSNDAWKGFQKGFRDAFNSQNNQNNQNGGTQ